MLLPWMSSRLPRAVRIAHRSIATASSSPPSRWARWATSEDDAEEDDMAMPAGSGRGLRTGQARSELQHVCQRHNWVTPKEWPHTRVGPPHEPVYTCYVSVTVSSEVTHGPFSGTAYSKDAAKDLAAVQALDALDPEWRARFSFGDSATQKRLALLGDAALDVLVSLCCYQQGLKVSEADAVRQQLLNNSALSGSAELKGKQLATYLEARFGQRLLRDQDQLLGMLKDVANDVDLGLLGRLDAAVAAIQARRSDTSTSIPVTVRAASPPAADQASGDSLAS